MKNTTRKITYGALIIACAVVLPQLFHLSGIPNSGAVFLPMHIPVLLGGCPRSSAACLRQCPRLRGCRS